MVYYPGTFTTSNATTYGLRVAFIPHDALNLSVTFSVDGSTVFSVPNSLIENYSDGDAYYVDTDQFQVTAIGTHSASYRISYTLVGSATSSSGSISFNVGGIRLGSISATISADLSSYRLQASGQGYTIQGAAYPSISAIYLLAMADDMSEPEITSVTEYTYNSSNGALSIDISQALLPASTSANIVYTIRVVYTWGCPDGSGGVSYTLSTTAESSVTVHVPDGKTLYFSGSICFRRSV